MAKIRYRPISGALLTQKQRQMLTDWILDAHRRRAKLSLVLQAMGIGRATYYRLKAKADNDPEMQDIIGQLTVDSATALVELFNVDIAVTDEDMTHAKKKHNTTEVTATEQAAIDRLIARFES